jgi:hypothetical protein
MIFAREISDSLTSLVKKIDAATAEHSSCRMGSFIVFTSDDEGLEAKLKDLAKNEKLEHVVLTIDNPQGPPRYKIAKDADVTVVLYDKQKVKANFAYKKGEMTEKDVEQIVADVTKILPDKEDKKDK